MPRWYKLLLHPDGDAGSGGSGDGGGESDSSGAGASAGTGDGGTSDSSGESADSSKLMRALEKERAERRALEAKLRDARKASDGAKSLEQRLAELEGENKQMRLRERVSELLDTHQKKAAKAGYKIDLPGAREMLALMSLSDDNVEAAVEKVATTLRTANTQKTQDNTQSAGEGARYKFDPSTFDHGTASLSDWFELSEADPAKYQVEMAKHKASLAKPMTEVLVPAQVSRQAATSGRGR